MTDLLSFFRDKSHFKDRERILFLLAVHEIKLESAKHGVSALYTEPEIDKDGYDFTVTCEYETLFIQSKAALSSSGAKQWTVHAGILQPSLIDTREYEIGNEFYGCDGATGCLLLHSIDQKELKKNNLKVSYRYLDIFYLLAIANEYIQDRSFSKDDAKNLIKRIITSDKKDRIPIPIRALFPITNVSSLVDLRYHISQANNYISLLRSSTRKNLNPELKELWKQTILNHVDEKFERRFS